MSNKYIKLEDAIRKIVNTPTRVITDDLTALADRQHEIIDMLSDLPTIEVSEDCISRVTALDIAVAYVGAEMVDRMLTAPSVIPKPKEGEWINKQEEYQMAECSNCKKVTMHEMWGDKLVYYDYCPNCGAKMKGAGDES